MKFKISSILKMLSGAAVILFVAAGCSQAEKGNQAEADEMALQMENGELPDPAIAARQEAKKYITGTFKDSMELHNMILESKAAQSRYLVAGRKQDAAVFDSVFKSTLKTIRPEIAAKLFPETSEKK